MRIFVAEVCLRALRAILAPTRGSRRRPATIRRLLVVNRLRIGDSVVTTPFLSQLRSAFPGTEITLLVMPPIQELFLNDPRIDVLVVQGQGKRRLACPRGKWMPGFDAAVLLDPTLRSGWIARRAKARWVAGYDSHARGVFLDARLRAPSYWNRPLREYGGRVKPLHQTEAWMKLGELLGLPPGSGVPWLALSDADKAWAREKLPAGPGKSPWVALHPGSDPAYRWEPERWAALAEALAGSRGARLCLTGGPGDRELAAAILSKTQTPILDFTAGTTLGQMAALLGEADALVSVDTSATHIASAVGTPCVALFGAGDPDIWRPYGEGHIVLRTEEALPCLGCKRALCALDRHACMLGIPVARVAQATLEILDRT